MAFRLSSYQPFTYFNDLDLKDLAGHTEPDKGLLSLPNLEYQEPPGRLSGAASDEGNLGKDNDDDGDGDDQTNDDGHRNTLRGWSEPPYEKGKKEVEETEITILSSTKWDNAGSSEYQFLNFMSYGSVKVWLFRIVKTSIGVETKINEIGPRCLANGLIPTVRLVLTLSGCRKSLNFSVPSRQPRCFFSFILLASVSTVIDVLSLSQIPYSIIEKVVMTGHKAAFTTYSLRNTAHRTAVSPMGPFYRIWCVFYGRTKAPRF